MKISDCKVELIDSMGTDLSVVNAARVSFNKKSYYLYDDDDPSVEYMSEKDMKLLKYLAEHNHHTPFGHCFLSFRIKAPIFVARQLGKHQVGLCWNEVSRRYVDEEPEFFFPKEWRKKAENVKQGSSNDVVKINLDEFTPHTDSPTALTYESLKTYSKLLDIGICPEQARMILPQNMMTEWIWSGSLLAFIRICNLRLDSHTQKETQDVAKQIAYHLDMRFPESWEVCKKYIENI
jgi:thymidylate synthase (FAD)